MEQHAEVSAQSKATRLSGYRLNGAALEAARTWLERFGIRVRPDWIGHSTRMGSSRTSACGYFNDT